MDSVRTAIAAPCGVLHRSVIDLIYVAAIVALFVLVGLIGRAVEKL